MLGSRNFCREGGGSSSDGPETALITLFLVLNSFLYFYKDPEGVHFFQGGGGAGPNAYFYRNTYNLRFSREGGPNPLAPKIHACYSSNYIMFMLIY